MAALTLNANETAMGRQMVIDTLSLCHIYYIEPIDAHNTFYLQNVLIEDAGLLSEMFDDMGIIVDWTV